MDFRLAREAIIGKMHRQFNLLFHEAESGLAKLAKQEHDLTLKVNDRKVFWYEIGPYTQGFD